MIKLETKCQSCGYVFEAATGLSGAKRPNPGSISICFKCGEIGVYDELLQVYPAPKHVLEELKTDKQTWEKIQKTVAYVKERGSKL